MRFEFEAANELRNGSAKHERIKQIHVIGDEKTGAVGIESGRPLDLRRAPAEPYQSAAKKLNHGVKFARIQIRTVRRIQARQLQDRNRLRRGAQKSRCGLPARRFSCHDVQRAGQNVEHLRLNRQDFAVHHHIHRAFQLKFDAGGAAARSQRMIEMRAVK